MRNIRKFQNGVRTVRVLPVSAFLDRRESSVTARVLDQKAVFVGGARKGVLGYSRKGVLGPTVSWKNPHRQSSEIDPFMNVVMRSLS